MPTISGLRRRGYTPEAVRHFCDRIGVARRDNTVDIALLEHTIRDDLNKRSSRVMGVLDPLKVVIENYPEGQTEDIVSVNNPEDMSMGNRKIPFSRTVYIERDDFREDPPPKFYRLSPGREVRLKDAYYITCISVVHDAATGEIVELRCTYDPETYGGTSTDGRKVRGTSHWVSADHAVNAEVRMYDHLFSAVDPDDVPDGGDFKDNLNPESLVVIKSAKLEQGLGAAKAGDRFQFLRQGYFTVDPDSTPEAPVFNRIVALRDTWSRMDRARNGN
jgi:glutaminyl-tRNA synthetase